MLVSAAAGGVGLAAIQLAKAWGGRPIALAGSEEKRRICLENGAEIALDYSDDSWIEAVREHAGSVPVIGNGDVREPADAVPEFVVSLDEPRRMDLAFETDRVLEGAQITILLTGSVEIDGYGLRRELSWTEDLEAGVNRLSLPVLANGFDGGQVVVRLSHPHSEQVFVVRLPVES